MRPLLRTPCYGNQQASAWALKDQFSTKSSVHRAAVPMPSLLLRRGSRRGGRGVSDGIAVDDELHAAVALAAFSGLIRSNRLRLAEAASSDRRSWYAVCRKKFADGVSAAFGELLIEFVAADAVGVPLDLQRETRMREQNTGNLCELLARAGLQRKAASVKKYVGHIHDKTARGIARLQDGIQLSEKLRAKLRFFGFGLRSSLAGFFGISLSSSPISSSLLGSSLGGGFFLSRLFGFGFGSLLLRKGGGPCLVGF